MNIYLLRHGQTEHNAKKAYYGKLDVDLNDNGIIQAKSAGSLLKNIEFDKIYTSEMNRTVQTVKTALPNLSFEYTRDSRINEMDLGVFEGKDYKQLESLYPDEWKCWSEDWKNFAPPQGESYVKFYNRVSSFMEDIKKLSCDNILISTHAGVIRSIFCYVLGGDLDIFWKFGSKNCDVSIIKYEYGNFYIDSITHV